MNLRRIALLTGSSAASLALSALVLPALAVSTRSFRIEEASVFNTGELDHAAVLSDGTVRSGASLTRIAMTDVPLAYRFVQARGGAVYVGTGNDGKVFKLQGSNLTLFAETHALVASALALGDGGSLFVGTLPEGKIFSVSPAGQLRELATPAGAEHIWALAYDATRHVLYAGTGPEGKLFSIDAQGHAEVMFDANASHIMSLALADDGSLYAGTSDDAVVLHVTGPGRAEVVWDFPGNEITALALDHGVLAVVANEFPDAPTAALPTKITPTAAASTGSSTTPNATPARQRTGKGKLFRVSRDGRAEEVFSSDDTYFTSIELGADNTIFAGAGKDGRIYRVADDRTSATWIDVDERQVLGVALTSRDPMFITGDLGAIYRVGTDAPADATWTSKVLDARFAARWGELSWRGEGAVRFETRAGNTERPDASWSAWSAPLTQSGPIRSPAARFLQLRAHFPNRDALLRSVSAYYLPQNQRATVRDIAGPPPPTSTGSGDDPRPTPALKLTWKVDNADADRLRFRLRFRAENQSVFRDITRESEQLTRAEYTWDTSSVPDGFYRIEVTATDELANPAAYVLRHTTLSPPILVDNHAPTFDAVTAQGTHARGTVRDTVGPITRLELAVDGGEWRPVFPVDDLLDTARESFDLDPGPLAPGPHILAIRAADAAGNVASTELNATQP